MKKISFSKTYPAYITLVVLLLLSIGAWWFLSNKVEAERKVEFNAAVTSVMQRLDLGVQQQEEVMVSMKSLYKSLVEVVKGVFELYGSIPVETRPYILSISYIPEIQESQKEKFVQNTRGELFSNEFDYKLDQTYTIFPEGSRASYFPITFIVPLSKNVYKCGYDVSQNKNLFSTIETALLSKKIAASAIHEVRKDTLGFYLVLKVENKPSPDDSEYDPNNPFANVKPKSRVIVLEIDAKIFFETVLGSKVASDELVSFEFLDKAADGTTKQIYASKSFTPEAKKSTNLHEVKELTLANRTLELQFASVPNFASGFASAVPYIVLFGGGFASFLFFGFVYSTITSRARAENLAEQMTRSQRRIVDSSKDIIASLEMNGVWKNMNPASMLLFGMEPSDLVGKPISQFD
jgi:CHASE1-domain containing sensor protein